MKQNYCMTTEQIKTEGGEVTLYGLTYENLHTNYKQEFPTLTSCKDQLEGLIALCQASEVTETTLEDILYDFICQ